MVEARDEIVNKLKKMSELIPRADSTSLADCYSEDTVVMPPNTGVVLGRPAVKAFWEYGFKNMGYKEAKFMTDEVKSFGEYAMERGTFTFRSQPRGQKEALERGKYITIWKHAPSGWLIHWDIFNSDLPPPQS